MTAADLKASILDRAVHGLLVPQDPNDEPAAKPSPIDNPPYDLPRGWVWKTIDDVADTTLGKMLNTATNKGDVQPYLCTINVRWGKFDFSRLKEMGFTKEELADCTLSNGDLALCEGGEAGRCAVWRGEKTIPIQNSIHRIRFRGSIYPEFIQAYFERCFDAGEITPYLTGVAIKHFTGRKLRTFPIPLPPLAEQKRIVAKIEELMPLVEEYGKAETELAALNDNFPTALRKSILQHAVEGRLTARWRKEVEVEETAAELLAKIAAEKKHLLASGKIKKQKPLLPITDDEKPFPIPDSWEWVRLGEIANALGGFAFKSTEYQSSGCRVIRISDFDEFGFVDKSVVYARYNEDLSPFRLEINDILLCMTGGTVGKSHLIKKIPCPLLLNQRVARIRSNYIIPEYLHINLKSPLILSIVHSAKTSTNDNISMELIQNFPIPLPPLAEQKAIVERVEELLALVEKMKE